MRFAQILTVPLYVDVIKVFSLGLLAFLFALMWTPILTGFLYSKRYGQRTKKKTVNGEKAPITKALTKDKEGTPTMGGLLVWVTALVMSIVFYFVAEFSEVKDGLWYQLNFLSRSQTWLPMFALVTTGVIGLLDDYATIKGVGSNKGGGIRFLYRFFWLIVIALLGGWWFYTKLGYDSIHIPGMGDVFIGWIYVLYFAFVISAAAISSNETDGLDGLNGGVLLMAFVAYTIISFFQGRIDLAAFSAVISGGLLAFLWFNIPPARFFMGDTGAFSLGATLGVLAMMTNTSLVLVIIAFVYVVESASVAIQIASKKWRGKKVFLAAPIHYHFRAMGWPEAKVVMRFWIVSGVMAVIGVIMAFFGGG